MKASVRKKRIGMHIFLGILLLFSSTLVWGENAPIETKVSMNVCYGFDNNIKSNTAVPVKVEVTSISGTVSGKIRLEIPVQSEGNLNASIWMSDIDGRNNKEQCYIWERDIFIETEESVEEIFYIELPMYESYLNVSILSEQKIIKSKQIRCDYTENNSRLMMGVISENETEINQMNGMQIDGDDYYSEEIFLKSISLDVEDIYDDPLALEQLDILVVDKGNDFSKAQRMAIDAWKKNGGLFYEREHESLLDVISLLKTGDYAKKFESAINEIDTYPYYSEDFDHIPLKEKVPIGRYLCIILLYLVVVGPGLYWMLKGKKEPYWLIGSVCVVSFLFMFIIYLAGRSINMGTPVICHETLYEQNENYRKVSIDFSVQAYQMQDFELVVDESYQILPKGIGIDGAKNVDKQMAETITFNRKNRQNTILLQNMSAYRQNCFYMEKYKTLSKEEQISFKINGTGDELQVYWENPTQYCMKQAIVVLENRIALIGDVRPHSHGTVEHAKLYAHSDSGLSMLLRDLLDFSTYTFPEYEIENLANVIWEKMNSTNLRNEQSFVIGILENSLQVFSDNVGFDVYGTSLMKIDVVINWSDEQTYWCPNLETYGVTYKGDFIENNNVLESKELIIEYQTSHMGRLLSLEFFPVHYSRQPYDILFDGKIYLFNWQTGMFTEVVGGNQIKNNVLLEPYVSNTGIIRIYYVMDEWLMNSDCLCILPCIKAAGKVE